MRATSPSVVRSPQPPNGLVQLTEGPNYTLSTVGNSLEVTILSLPPEFPIPGKYDFQVFVFVDGGRVHHQDVDSRPEREPRTLQQPGELPYYSVNVGAVGRPVGARFGGARFRRPRGGSVVFPRAVARARRVRRRAVDDQPVPGRANLQVVSPIGPSTNVNGTATSAGPAFPTRPPETAACRRIPRGSSRRPATSSSSFSHTPFRSPAGAPTEVRRAGVEPVYSLDAALSWRIGKLDLSGGANYTSADSQSGRRRPSRAARCTSTTTCA